jgi:hypothetical protein
MLEILKNIQIKNLLVNYLIHYKNWKNLIRRLNSILVMVQVQYAEKPSIKETHAYYKTSSNLITSFLFLKNNNLSEKSYPNINKVLNYFKILHNKTKLEYNNLSKIFLNRFLNPYLSNSSNNYLLFIQLSTPVPTLKVQVLSNIPTGYLLLLSC